VSYPIAVDYTDQLENRNRLTTAFRLILAIPHMILVGGGPSVGWNNAADRGADGLGFLWDVFSGGVLSIALFFTSVFSWFAIVFTGRMPESLWNFGAFVVGWHFRAQAYIYLLTDEYPPFGDVPSPRAYSAQFDAERPGERNRVTVFFRIFMIIPHLIVLFFLEIAALILTVIAWFAILFTGRFPAGVYGFVAGVLAWRTRVYGYGVLLTDEYPPFSLDREPVPPSAGEALAAPA
jgi:hypothetical protein